MEEKRRLFQWSGGMGILTNLLCSMKKIKKTILWNTNWGLILISKDTLLKISWKESFFKRIYISVEQTSTSVNTDVNETRKLIGMHNYSNGCIKISTIEVLLESRIIHSRQWTEADLKNSEITCMSRIKSPKTTIDCGIDSFVNCCRSLQLQENLCVDKQMIPFKGKLDIKQYLKCKPKQWGIKSFLLCGEDGTVYDMVEYQVKTTSTP